MKILLKILRNGLGGVIAFISWLVPTQPIKRTAEQQAKVDEQTSALKLYQFFACPFCIKARRAIRRLNLKIETRNAQSKPFHQELRSGGGEVKVPCLQISNANKNGEVEWMYESDDIIAYLEKRFAK